MHSADSIGPVKNFSNPNPTNYKAKNFIDFSFTIIRQSEKFKCFNKNYNMLQNQKKAI